jgi:hypothetical protein
MSDGVVIGPAGEINGVCPALPSSTTAYRVMSGDRGALALLLRDFAGRTLLVGLGAYLFGVRGATLVRAAAGGALTIEAFVLWWAHLELERAKALAATNAATSAATPHAGTMP